MSNGENNPWPSVDVLVGVEPGPDSASSTRTSGAAIRVNGPSSAKRVVSIVVTARGSAIADCEGVQVELYGPESQMFWRAPLNLTNTDDPGRASFVEIIPRQFPVGQYEFRFRRGEKTIHRHRFSMIVAE